MIPSPATLKHWTSREAPVLVQFIKYGLCGGIAAGIQVAIALVLASSLFPAMDGMTVNGAPITDALRERNLVLANALAFPFSNLGAYLLNVRWVFTSGRHDRFREFSLFTGISAASFFAGLLGGPLLIGWFGIPSLLAQFTFIITSAIVNFLCRKFLVFAQ